MKVLFLPVLLGTLGLALVACAPRVIVEHDHQANFFDLHTFAWVTPPPGPVNNPILDSDILEGRVQRAVVADLTRRGYTQTDSRESADFLVTYHTVSKQKLESTPSSFSIGFGGYYPYGYGSVFVPISNTVQSREQGTLMLDIINAHTNRLIWRGWTNDWISKSNYSEQAVANDVQRILAKFPPQRGS